MAHVSLSLSAPQKQELLVAPGSDMSLFNQSLVGKVSGQVKEDAFISSSLSLAKLAKSGSRAGLPLVQRKVWVLLATLCPWTSHPSPSGHGKRSASPARGSGAKRDRGDRGMSPSPNARKAFGSRSHVPVPYQLAVVCRSTGRHGATGARNLG